MVLEIVHTVTNVTCHILPMYSFFNQDFFVIALLIGPII